MHQRKMAAMRKKKVRKKAEPKPKSPEELYASAQRALELDDPELARKCLQRAVELAPTSAELAEAYGCLLSEMGRREEALQALRRAVELQPDTGFEKYMYLGQLLEGESAIEASKKGVEVMESALAAMDGEGSAGAAAGLREQLAAGLCSLAEMYMAAAADVSAVADDCQQLLRRAADVHPDSPEPLQTLASLRYELGGMEEALQLLKESMSIWFQPRKAEGSGEGGMEDGEADGEEEGGTAGMAVDGPDGGEAQLPGGWEPAVRKPEADSGEPAEARGDDAREEALPSYEFRYECAKLLVELDRTTDTAIQVLEDLLQENDGVVDVWHTLSLAYYGGGHLEEAQETLEHGQQLAARQGMPPESGMALAFQDLRAAVEDAKTKLGQAHS